MKYVSFLMKFVLFLMKFVSFLMKFVLFLMKFVSFLMKFVSFLNNLYLSNIRHCCAYAIHHEKELTCEALNDIVTGTIIN
jgi:hypothetical protein